MAEIAAGNVPHPMQVLQPQRVAQAELRHVAGPICRAQFGEPLHPEDGDERVARQDAQDREDQHRDGENRHQPESQPAHDIAVHGAGTGVGPAWRDFPLTYRSFRLAPSKDILSIPGDATFV